MRMVASSLLPARERTLMAARTAWQPMLTASVPPAWLSGVPDKQEAGRQAGPAVPAAAEPSANSQGCCQAGECPPMVHSDTGAAVRTMRRIRHPGRGVCREGGAPSAAYPWNDSCGWNARGCGFPFSASHTQMLSKPALVLHGIVPRYTSMHDRQVTTPNRVTSCTGHNYTGTGAMLTTPSHVQELRRGCPGQHTHCL